MAFIVLLNLCTSGFKKKKLVKTISTLIGSELKWKRERIEKFATC